MKSKFVSVVVCFAFLAMLAVPAALAPVASAAGGPPVYSVGDSWVYETHYDSGPTGVPNPAPRVNDGELSNVVSDTSAPGPYFSLRLPSTNGTYTKSPNLTRYSLGTKVVITEVPNSGYTFTGWSGDATGTANPVTVTMDGSKAVKANYTHTASTTKTLTVNISGAGSVTKSPDLSPYPTGTTVTLTAVPTAGNHFVNWTGSGAPSPATANPGTITMDGNKTVTANFAAGDGGPFTLTTNATHGSITKNPTGASYTGGTKVTLTAVPDAGYHFTCWTDDASGTTSPVDVTMDRNKTVTANFSKDYYNINAVYNPDALRINPFPLSPVTVKGADVSIYKDNMLYQQQYAQVMAYDVSPDNANVEWFYTSALPTSWPPSVGATWSFNKRTMDDMGIVDATVSRVGKVLGVEDVTVTAGTFSCLHIAEYDPADPANIPVPTKYLYEHWFSDAVGSDVKMIDRETFLGEETRELTSYTYVPPSYTLTTHATHGSVTRDPVMTTYPMGTKVKLTATEETGYHFTGWSGDASGTDNPLTVTMDANKDVTANFAINTYTLALNATSGGSATKVPDQVTYNHGTQVTLTANADATHHFTKWTGNASGTTSPLTITMDANKTITANFAENVYYTLTIGASSGGSATKDPNQEKYLSGTEVEVTAKPDTDYHFTNWSDDASGTDNPLTVTMEKDKTVTPNFAVNVYYKLTLNADHGSVTRDPELEKYLEGAKVKLTATPDTGYHFTGWSGDASGTDNTVTVTMDKDRTVNANFAINTYTLTLNATSGGSATKVPDQATYNHGTQVTLTATEDSTHHFTKWTGDESGTTSPLTITMDKDKIVTANFAINTFSLTVNATHGSVTKDPNMGDYPAGTEVKLTATPDTGYHFTGWSDGASGTDNPVTVTMDKDKTVTANFAINTYTLALNATSGGSAAKDPDQETYPHGTEVKLTATPDTGYHFTGWSGDKSGMDNPLTITMDANKTVTTNFSDTYTLTVNSANGSVTKDPDLAKYPTGTQVKLTAVPDSGYHFTNWSGDASGTDNPVTVTLDADKTVTANFAANPPAQLPPTSGPSTWFLAEGTCAWGFSTYITIENPNSSAVTVKITYMDPQASSGGQSGKGAVLPPRQITIAPTSQTTINPRDDLGYQTDFSTKVECTEGKTIAVDRTMTWTGPGAASPEAHSSIGTSSPSTTWYLPEGSTNWGFETWTVVQNPNATQANVKLIYMTEDAGPKVLEKKIPAYSRATYNMASDIGSHDSSIEVTSDVPVIAERSLYRNNRREGACSIGATTPAADYYLAEGTTAWGFTTYVLVQNPNDAAANVTVTYMTDGGAQPQAPFSMPANSRKTIRVNDVLQNKDLSTQVHADKPIIAERSMYWGEGTSLGEACHDSIGMDSPHTAFYLPDGQTSEGRETWTLVQNPNAEAVTVEISYLTLTGQGNVTFPYTIPARSRKTFNMAEKGINGRAAVMVTSTTAGKKIMVERAMYWNSRGAGTDTIGGYSD